MNLEGIDGGHLWGFMAALGALALLEDHEVGRAVAPVRLHFLPQGSPVLSDGPSSPTVLAERLWSSLQRLRPFLESDLSEIKRPGDFSLGQMDALARTASRSNLNMLAGLGCCIGPDAFESSLCAANGASHQNLIQSMRDVISLTTMQHIEDTLFIPWRKAYRVPPEVRKEFNLGTRKPTLRLDPADERLYALRSSNPTTTDDFKTELGAQALAIPAYGVLSVVPRKRPIAVSSYRKGNRVMFSWTLWNRPATLASIRSLLVSGVNPQEQLQRRGAFAAFRVARVSGAKGKLSFAPSEGVW